MANLLSNSSSVKKDQRSNSLIAVCQMTSTSDIETNIKTCKELIFTAQSRGAKVIFLPEAFDYISETKEQSLSMAQHLDGPIITDMCRLAKELCVWLSLGGFHEKDRSRNDNRISVAHVMISDQGEIAAVYRKCHLFDVDIKGGPCLRESDYVVTGKEIVEPVKTPAGNVGLAVCYDMRFPEMSLMLAQRGAHILTFPSAFTQVTGLAHWEAMLRCRAIETQCYVVAAAQTGKHNAKRQSYGHAMVVDPWGCVVAQCHEGTDVCIAEIDHNYIRKVRTEMPVWSHRRTDLYGTVGRQ